MTVMVCFLVFAKWSRNIVGLKQQKKTKPHKRVIYRYVYMTLR